jgi:hypothetical protein
VANKEKTALNDAQVGLLSDDISQFIAELGKHCLFLLGVDIAGGILVADEVGFSEVGEFGLESVEFGHFGKGGYGFLEVFLGLADGGEGIADFADDVGEDGDA